jgi:DNA-binding transcriptional LysR family regulator
MQVTAFTNDLDGALALLLAGYAVVPMPRGVMRPYLRQRLVRELPIRPRVNQLATEVVYDPSVPLRPEAEFLLRELGGLG